MKGQPLSIPPFVKIFSFTCMARDNLNFTKLQVTICKQLNVVPYLGSVHGISLLHMCTSLTPRPMTIVFGLGRKKEKEKNGNFATAHFRI